jgi:hypothetical protein
MKKLITLLLLFAITLFYSIPTQAYDIPLNYGVSDNDQAFVQTKNLFQNNVAQTLTVNGITIESFGNGEFLIDGTPTINTRIGLFNELNFQTDLTNILANTNDITIKNNTNYKINFFVISGSITSGDLSSFNFLQSASYFINSYNYISNETINNISTSTTAYFYTFLSSSTVFTDYKIKIQIEEGTTRTSYAPYGFLSLNDIFLDSQIFTNPDFDTDTTGWTFAGNTSNTVSNGILNIITGSTSFSRNISRQFSNVLNKKLYIITNIKNDRNVVIALRQQLNSGAIFSESPTSLFSGNISIYGTPTVATPSFYIAQTTAFETNININYIYAYDTTTLGIDNLTQYQLDGLFFDWQINNIYDQGFNDGYTDGFNDGYTDGFNDGFNDGYTDGFNDGYDDGFDDGVASDTSFAVGYALGLSQGADMETGSSLLILIVALIGFILMIIGFITKRGIFNLLSTGAFIVLGGLLVEFVGFIIIAIGLVLINIYYAFFGNV